VIELSDDPARLDMDVVHRWLASSYRTPSISRDTVEKAARGSHALGAYQGGTQVGYARAVTDHVHFAWIDDVWVDEAARGQGIARAMVRWFLDHPSFATVGRFALATRDAHSLYEDLGFQPLLRPERWLERLSAEADARVRGRQ
jgi:GNAT superfamily N-acetyltransferase